MYRAARAGRGETIASAILIGSVLLLGGCGSGSDGSARLTVYLSAPKGGANAEDAGDIADGARLALADAGGEAAGVPVDLEVLDEAVREGADAAQAAANARRATQDSTAIAYIGEFDSGTTRTSLPITNEAGMLQVSASASAVDLTRQAPGSNQIPGENQPSGTRTFGRVIPSDTAQGAAAAVWMANSGVKSTLAVDGTGTYGEALVDGFESPAGAPAVVSPGFSGRTDGLYLVSDRPLGAPLEVGADTLPFAADAQIEGSPPESTLPPPARIVSGALAPTQLPDSAAAFLADFRSTYHRAPGRFAAYGYEAMAVVLDSISRADEPLDRKSVVEAFFATTDRDSILGRYAIDEVGDTTLDRVGAYVVASGGPRAAPRPLTVP